MQDEQMYDVIIIGAGLGGLLTAAQFLAQGKQIALVERLNHVGGRFTAKTFQGAQISTGAVHMLPFGTNGIVAAMLRELHVPHAIHDAEVFGSFHVRGRQIPVRSLLALARVFGPRQFATALRLAIRMLLHKPKYAETQMSFADWLEQQGVSEQTDRELVRFFARVSHFTLSVDLDQVSYPEVVETLKNMLRYGPPGIVEGGCGALAAALEQRVREQGGTILLGYDVATILQDRNGATGAIVSRRADGTQRTLLAPMVISNVGVDATRELLQQTDAEQTPLPAATGLKTHLLLDRSFIPHKGILYCLDTERIAGIVQPSNSDPSLAPSGKHLLITHQLWRPEQETIAEARQRALRDIESLLGPAEQGGWTILTMSQYHDAWPVDRAVQGLDRPNTLGVDHLLLVGDAVKPSGYLMVEGVAQSVNVLLDTLAATSPAHVAPKPSNRRALRWLIAPPSPHPVSTASPRSGDANQKREG